MPRSGPAGPYCAAKLPDSWVAGSSHNATSMNVTAPKTMATIPQRRDPRRNTTTPRAATVRPRSSLTSTSGSAHSTAARWSLRSIAAMLNASSGTASATSWKSNPIRAPKPGARP